MGGITTGVGIFSGIDSASLIDQLINASSRPLVLAQSRVIQLNAQQAAYLDINTRLSAFKAAAASFRLDKVFSGHTVVSNNESVLTAAAGVDAVPGSYNFIVDRLVSTQQMLTRGFANLDETPVGLDSLTFESVQARLDADTDLANLNNGDGITRGKIKVNGVEVDLSRVGTVQEVLDAIGEVDGVSARVENDKFVIEGVSTITEEPGAGILASLGLDPAGISGTTLTGTGVYSLSAGTPLAALNDGRGVEVRDASGVGVSDFSITIDSDGNGIIDENDTKVDVRIGEIEGPLFDDEGEPILDDEGEQKTGVTDGAVSSVGGVVERINSALSDAGFGEFAASINTSSGGIDITDSLGRAFDIENYSSSSRTITAADDLGISGSYTGGTASGRRVLAGLNTKLVSGLNGGRGLDGADGLLNITTRDGTIFSGIDLSGLADINDIINTINSATGGKVTASVNAKGTGIKVTDNSTTVTGDLVISGTTGQDTAAALGIDGSFSDGEADGSNLQLAYISQATALKDLNNGQGIGTGTFEIVDSFGKRAEIRVSSTTKTVGDLIKEINGAGLGLTARINDTGDGIVITENDPDDEGSQPIAITDISGSVAEKLHIAGKAPEDGADNFIDGSFERVVEFEPDATLEDVRNAIDAANVGVSASIINTGNGTAPFRLNLTSERTGEDGRFLIDSGAFELGLTTLDQGNDARVFFGSGDPATGVLLTSSVNQLDGVVQGVTIDLKSASDDPVELSVSSDSAAIESKVKDFVAAFNKVVEAIDSRTRYNAETEEKGVLLGDGTLLNLRNSMFSMLRHANEGFTDSFNTLSEVGITVGEGSKLVFNAEKFRDAYAADPGAVEALFTQREQAPPDDDPNTIDEVSFTRLSVLGQFENFAESYVASIGGVLQNRTNALDAQIKLQEDRIASIQAGLDNKRHVLERQFLAMEQAIGQLQSQGSSLSQLAALG